MNGDRLEPELARLVINFCLDDGILHRTNHFDKERENEKVMLGDCTFVLENGYIFEDPVWDDEHHEWKYRIDGYEPDGKWLNIIFSFTEKDSAKLITVFSSKPRRKPGKEL